VIPEKQLNSLKIKKKIRDKAGESVCYGNLGVAYYSLGDFKKAIEFNLKAEKIFEELGQINYLKLVYENTAKAYNKMDDFENAEKYKIKAEDLSELLKNPLLEILSMGPHNLKL